MRSKFKDEHPFEKRKAEAERIVSPAFPNPSIANITTVNTEELT